LFVCCFTTVCFVVLSIYHHLEFPSITIRRRGYMMRTWRRRKREKRLIQVCEEEQEASHLNVHIHLLNFSALFVGQMMLSIKNKNELFVYGQILFLIATHRIRLILFFPFSHHAKRRAVKEIFSGILSRSSKVDQNQSCVCIKRKMNCFLFLFLLCFLF